MILPRFTIRTGLAGVAICALVFLVAGMAVRGDNWAWGITIALISLVVTMLVHAAWYVVARMTAQMLVAPAAAASDASSVAPPKIQSTEAVGENRANRDEAKS